MLRLLMIGALLCDLALLAVACGKDSTRTVYREQPEDPEPADDEEWLKVKPVVAANCGGCHDGVKQKPSFATAAGFKGSNAKARIEAGTMPPSPRTLLPRDRDILLAYLGG